MYINHEIREMNRTYGFEGEAKRKHGEQTYKLFAHVFTASKGSPFTVCTRITDKEIVPLQCLWHHWYLRPLWKLRSLQNTLISVIAERNVLTSLLDVLVEDSSLTDNGRQCAFPLLEDLVIENAMITDVVDVPLTSDADEQPNPNTPSSIGGVLRILKTWTVRNNKTIRLNLLRCSVPLPGYRDAFRSVNIVLAVALGRVVIPAATTLSIPAGELFTTQLDTHV